jgi:hypothetical protein
LVSLQARPLEQARAIGGADAQPERPGVANDLDWNLDGRRPAAPDLAVKTGKALDLRPGDARENAAAAAGPFSRS